MPRRRERIAKSFSRSSRSSTGQPAPGADGLVHHIDQPGAAGSPVLIGTIVRAHGLRGEVLVQASASAREALRQGMHVVVAETKEHRALEAEILRVAPHRVGAIVRLEGIADRDAAALLAGRELTAARAELPAARGGELYVCDVVGASAYSPTGELLGTVEEIITTGANDVWVVRDRGRELLVPAVAHAILEVDLARRRIVIDTSAATRADDGEER